MKNLEVRLAYVLGVALPLLETLRRRTNFSPIAMYVDDYIAGILLVMAARAVTAGKAWGAAVPRGRLGHPRRRPLRQLLLPGPEPGDARHLGAGQLDRGRDQGRDLRARESSASSARCSGARSGSSAARQVARPEAGSSVARTASASAYPLAVRLPRNPWLRWPDDRARQLWSLPLPPHALREQADLPPDPLPGG